MAKISGLLLILGFLFCLGFFLFADTAAQLNAQGYKLYEQGRLDEALVLFRQAFTADGTYAYAHYNYACTAALLLERSYCGYMELIGEIKEHLKIALSLRPAYQAKLMADPDLNSLRTTYWFLRLAGFDPARPQDLEYILTNLTWFGPAPGVFPASPQLTFSVNQTFTMGTFSSAGESNPGFEFHDGTYSLDGYNIRLLFGDIEVWAVFQDGIITFPGGEYPNLSDHTDPCGV